MTKRIFALNAVALVALASVSCNFMMPTANYPVMRQEKGFILLESYSIRLYDSLNGIKFGFCALDGFSSQNGAGSPTAYISLTTRFKNEGLIAYLTPGSFLLLNGDGTDFDKRRISYDAGSGFISVTDEGINRIESAYPSIVSNQLYTKATIESGASGSAFHTLAANLFPATNVRGIFSDVGALAARETATLPNTTLIGPAPFADGVAFVAGSFERLTDAAYPTSSFWNPGSFDYGRMGFPEAGGYTWFEAFRRDNITGDEEVRLVSLPDDGSSIRTSPLEPAGGAGNYILAWKSRKAPGFSLAVLDGSLNEVHGLSIYGHDAAYLGEALIPQTSGMVRSAIFATLGIIGATRDGEGMVVINLFAYPVSLLDGSAP